jgi:glycerol-3-phosphate dehydrogenase
MTAIEEEFDLIVIGGGINGVAIARDASLRGLKTILFEKNDFGYGASSKSSKLIHGGLRYLAQGNLRLVKESLSERAILLNTIPHLVKKTPFIIPVFKGEGQPLWMIRLGLYCYDFLSSSDFPSHRFLKPSEALSLFPSLRKDGLKGACLYYDAQMQDNRIVIENMLSASLHGAHMHSYSRVTELKKEEGQIVGVYVEDLRGSPPQLFRAKQVVNATGSWTSFITALDESSSNLNVYPTKGVHLIIPTIHSTHALLLTAKQDGRVFFLIPWNGYSLLGTTDTPYLGQPDDVKVESEDIDYLLRALNAYFPYSPIQKKDIIAEFAGLRPLVSQAKLSPSLISRDFQLTCSPAGLISIVGGKYTTYRLMAEKVVDQVIERLKRPSRVSLCKTASTPLFELSAKDKSEIEKIDHPELPRLLNQYGSACLNILKIMFSDPHQAERICPYHPHIWAELTYAIQVEKALTVEDWFERRTSIAYTTCRGLKCLEITSQYFAKLLSRDVSKQVVSQNKKQEQGTTKTG